MLRLRVLAVGLVLGVSLAGLFPGFSVQAGAVQDEKALQAQDRAKTNLAPPAAESSLRSAKGRAPATARNTPPAGPTDVDPEPDVYRIGVEDELQIAVWREPELSTSVVVRPDGKVSLPLLNDISVVGLRPEELTVLLTEKLKGFVNEPQVTVIVRQIHSRKIFVFGEVVRPGTYSLNSEKTVLQLLAEAGGLGSFAKSDQIYILRSHGGRKVYIRFNYKKALAGRGDNPLLRPGDMVVVP